MPSTCERVATAFQQAADSLPKQDSQTHSNLDIDLDSAVNTCVVTSIFTAAAARAGNEHSRRWWRGWV